MSAKGMSKSDASHAYLVDVGSTVIKLAHIDADGRLIRQEFHNRDYQARIVDQVSGILRPYSASAGSDNLVVCSSANGGLRVGIVCLTNAYSGEVLRNQTLLSGANPVFLEVLDSQIPRSEYVDILLVGGGMDLEDHLPFRNLIERFDPSRYRFGSLVYAGNRFFSGVMSRKNPETRVIGNPIETGLGQSNDSVFVALRDAYLDDLVYKEGISELAGKYQGAAFPTPEVVNHGFHRCITRQLFPEMTGASLLVDIGGATTDFHYTVEVVRDDSPNRPNLGHSVARYVFADLGIFTSRDSTTMQLRQNPRTYEFLKAVIDRNVSDYYRSLREGELELEPAMLAYACVFLALDRFVRGAGPGLPSANLARLNNIAFTGGAAQLLDVRRTAAVISLFLPCPVSEQFVFVDRNYEIWVQGALSHLRHTAHHAKSESVASAS